MKNRSAVVAVMIVSVAVASVSLVAAGGTPQQPAAPTSEVSPQRALLDQYCVRCHNERTVSRPATPDESVQVTQLRNVGLALDTEDVTNVAMNPEVWEKVVRKLRAGDMPPAGRPRPDTETHEGFIRWLETELDGAAVGRPDPGRPAMRRLTQTEYTNAIRDLLAVEIGGPSLLFPADDLDQHGFDTNGGVLSVSPALLERYLAAARRISRLAIGDPTIGPGFAGATYAVPKMLLQNDRRSEDLPFGSRGGLAIRHYFPLDGEYGIKIPPPQTNLRLRRWDGHRAAARCAPGWRAHRPFHGGWRG